MSSNRAVQKRLSLMAGSSLAAAWLLTLAGAVVLAPSWALAANECGNPAGPDPDTFNCSGTYASVSYVTDGALTLNLDDTLNVTGAGIAVSGADPITLTIGATADGADLSIVNTAGAGIDLTGSGPGDIYAIVYDSDPSDGDGEISGTTHGIRVASSGGGGIVFVYTEGVTVEGAIGVEVSATGATPVFVTLNDDLTATDTAILLDAPGVVDINIGSASTVTAGTGPAVRILGGTGPITITNAGDISGRLDIASAGGTTIVNTGEWRTSGANLLNTDTATLTTSGLLATDSGATTLDFGSGGAVTSSGMVAVGVGAEGAATLRLEGVDGWTNSARLLFGSNADMTGSDGVANDRIVAAGAAFEGEITLAGKSVGLLFMDANFAAQPDCSAAVGADCLDLDGGASAGVSAIVVRRAANAGPGGTAPVVLVDLGGPGGGGQGDFVLSDQSDGYRQGQAGAVDTIDAGLFRYALRYLPDTGQHALVGAPDVEIAEFGLIGDAALAAWDASTNSWAHRQADLRDAIGRNTDVTAPGVWLKVISNKIEYTLLQDYSVFGSDFTYNTSYAQDTQSIVGGVDLLRTTGSRRGWVAGVTAGKTTSELDFRASPTLVEMEGYSLGAYASLFGERYFIDAIVNSTKLDLEYGGAGLADSGEVSSLGVQVEGGFRFGIAEGWAFIEPLAAFSHVTTEAPELDLSGVDVRFEEATTTRGSLGLRVGGRLPFETLTATVSGTGRVWQEFEGEDRVSMLSNGPAVEYATDTGDVLGDIGAGVGVFSKDLRFSAGFDVSHRFKQNYSSTDLSVHLRYWF